ncbi:MAG: MFS transporter [Erysipelotrichaceae bacterium]|nr:MFS transporter [Erysipelotrichaceae bacterium]
MLNIIFLGLVSFFADISSEMVYPIIPLYLTAAFGATPLLVGFIEGIAESLASLLKVYSGYLTDKYQKKKPVAFIGYATGLIYKIALLVSTSWTGILISRIIDRIGKGIRTSPRDVMVSESAKETDRGQAFGIHKALDMLGSAIGIILSYFILLRFKDNTSSYKLIFIISIIPAVIALLMFLFIKEKNTAYPQKERTGFLNQFKNLDQKLKMYLLISMIFTLGNSSNSFLLLRANTAGFDATSVILLYFIYNVTASLLAIPFGRMSDRFGRKNILITGYIIFAVVYFGFGIADTKMGFMLLFMLYGIYTATTAGVERALITDIAPANLKGTMLGLQQTIVGISLFFASIIFGFLWNNFGSFIPFAFGATLSLISAILLMITFRKRD